MLVEDEPLIALSIEMSLQDAGHYVRYAATGIDAWAVLEARPLNIACLVTDVRCGAGPRGWEIARHARSILPNLPVVYVSGDGAMDHARLGVAHSLMVPKPFHVDAIVQAVRALLVPGRPKMYSATEMEQAIKDVPSDAPPSSRLS